MFKYCFLKRVFPKSTFRAFCAVLAFSVVLTPKALSSSSQNASPSASSLIMGDHHKNVAQIYEHIRQNPAQIGLFLRDFPKGADLHNHLVGAIYAESFLQWAAEDGLCIDMKKGRILAESCGKRSKAEGYWPGEAVARDSEAWNYMIDMLSMRDFLPLEADRSGHDHFFATFDKFDMVAARHNGDMLAEALSHAAADNVHYVEFMISPALGAMIRAGKEIILPRYQSGKEGEYRQALTKADKALASLVPGLVTQARQEVDRMEAQAKTLLHCGTPQALPGCQVQYRYLFQSVRIVPPPMLYSQLVTGYALVKQDSRFVGVNIVAPEDDAIALADYDAHMQMFNHLAQLTPGVALSLHAGELTPGLVPPKELDHHIRGAVEQAGALRIGHGVDVLWEKDPENLIEEMARKKIMVEINLTSNAEILGLKGAAHPFMLYRRSGVPVALSSDDEGVSRGSLSAEYVLAVQSYALSYDDLVQLSRTGLEYSFLPGESLWSDHVPGRIKPVCRQSVSALFSAGKKAAQPACQTFLTTHLKALLQWQFEERLAAFEARIVKDPLLAPVSVPKALGYHRRRVW